MQYRENKKNGDKLSTLGFGCMRLPQKKGTPGSGKIDEGRATAQVRMAVDQGINFIDTAYLYHLGASEPFLGRALTDGYRDKVKLCTKLPCWLPTGPQDMDTILNRQLERLNTDRLDYYLVHGLNGPLWDKMKAMGIVDFLDRAKSDGRVVSTGFSFHGEQEAFLRIVDDYDWDCCMIQYNYLDENCQAGRKGLQYAASKDLGVFVMEPLRGGLLAAPPPAVEKIWARTEEKRTPAEWALRWIWNHPEVTVILSGMNEEEHIRDNIRIAGEAQPGSLSPHDLDLIESVRNEYMSLMKTACTGCSYCLPCPRGVDIPACFETYNYKHMHDDARWGQIFYLMRVGGATEGSSPGKASQCTGCGQCLEKCPQNIPIPDLLNNISAEMEGRLFNTTVKAVRLFNRFQRWKLRRGQ